MYVGLSNVRVRNKHVKEVSVLFFETLLITFEMSAIF